MCRVGRGAGPMSPRREPAAPRNPVDGETGTPGRQHASKKARPNWCRRVMAPEPDGRVWVDTFHALSSWRRRHGHRGRAASSGPTSERGPGSVPGVATEGEATCRPRSIARRQRIGLADDRNREMTATAVSCAEDGS